MTSCECYCSVCIGYILSTVLTATNDKLTEWMGPKWPLIVVLTVIVTVIMWWDNWYINFGLGRMLWDYVTCGY